MLQRLREDKERPETGDIAVRSGGEAEHPFDESVLRSDVALYPPNLSLPNLVHRLVALNRPPRTTELANMLLGTDPFLDGAVIVATTCEVPCRTPRGSGASGAPAGRELGGEVSPARPDAGGVPALTENDPIPEAGKGAEASTEGCIQLDERFQSAQESTVAGDSGTGEGRCPA